MIFEIDVEVENVLELRKLIEDDYKILHVYEELKDTLLPVKK